MSYRFLTCLLLALPAWAVAQDTPTPDGPAQGSKPNIVLVFMDNFGWGEPGFNGAVGSFGERRRRDSTGWLPRVSA